MPKSPKVKQVPAAAGRILCIDDYPAYVEMVGAMLSTKGGHTVQAEIVPVSLKAIEGFRPDVIVINLVRKLETISAGGMRDFYTDVEGAKAFREIARAVKAGQLHAPVVITSLAVLEHELPKEDGLDYVAFIEVPQKVDVLLRVIAKVLETAREGGGIAPE